MTVPSARPDDGGARSAVTPAGPIWPAAPHPDGQVTARPKVTASPEVIARLLAGDDLVKMTRAERNARMPSPLKVASTALSILSTALLGFALYLGFVSQLHHDRAQLTAYADFRARLALATAPVGQSDPDDPTKLLTPGSAIAVLEIPRLGLKEVVFEGTDSSVLTDGPGHMRSTPLP